MLTKILYVTILAVASIFLSGCTYRQNPASSTTPAPTPSTVNGDSGLASAVIGDTPGLQIPADFVGLSHEWGVVEDLVGSSASGKNLQYRQLLANLLQYTNKSMVLRIGGNSTDTTTSLEVADLVPLNELYSDLGKRLSFTLGINMAADNPSVASAEIESIASSMSSSSVLGLELGNEPDSYIAKGLRPTSFTFAAYMTQLRSWKALVSSGSSLDWVSPALAALPWVDSFEQELSSSDAPRRMVTQHYYAGEYLQAQPKSTDFLLEDQNATSGPTQLAPYIAAAHGTGKKLRIGELNSLSNGGQPGVSDSFSAALWAVDIMFEFAKVGADGVNWHTVNGGGYGLFQFSWDKDLNGSNAYSLVQVRPIFYGLQLFEEAATSNGRLLPVTLTTGANLKVWALKGDDGHVRIVVINKDEASTGSVRLTIPGYSRATVSRMLAPSLSSQTGVTLGGQTYDGSLDGRLQGSLDTSSMIPADGSFTFDMSTVSAALVTLSK